MKRLKQLMDEMNVNAFHARGLHIVWPRQSAFLFLEIEYYVSGSCTESVAWRLTVS